MDIRNAKIEDTMLGIEDHGIFTSMIQLDYGDSSHQGFGGYVLGGSFGVDYIKGLLNVVGVEKWEDLVGKYIRVKIDNTDGWNGKIIGIGNITKDEWFYPEEEAQKYKKSAEYKDMVMEKNK